MSAPSRLDTEIREFTQDEDLGREDLWLFGPLLVVMVGLPLAIAAVLGASLWYSAQRLDLGVTEVTQTPAATVASRWPDKALPETTVVR